MARPRTVEDDEILAAAARAVARSGPWSFTLTDVAEDVGVTPSALVQRFGSKRALLLALAESGVEDAERAFARARRAEPRPLEALLTALAARTRNVRTPGEILNSLAFLQVDLSDPEFREVTQRFLHVAERATAALLSDAVAAGELAPCDTEVLAHAVEVAYTGSLLTWGIHQEGTVEEAVRRDVLTLLAPYRT